MAMVDGLRGWRGVLARAASVEGGGAGAPARRPAAPTTLRSEGEPTGSVSGPGAGAHGPGVGLDVVVALDAQLQDHQQSVEALAFLSAWRRG